MNKKTKTIVGIMIVISLVATLLLGCEYIKKEDAKPEYLKNLKLISSGESSISGIPVKRTTFHDEQGEVVEIEETQDGEIIFYFSFGKLGKQGTKNLTEEEALKIAKEEIEVPEDYVFSGTENGRYSYTFIFNRVVEGILLRCDRIHISVNKGTGEISSWVKIYHEELPNLNPTISEEEALKIANEEFDGGAEIKELTVDICWDDKLCLAWIIEDKDSEIYRAMFLDAHTGRRTQ